MRILAPALALSLFACAPASDSDTPKPTPASKTIGAAGGSLASSDGALTVEIPAGALADDVTITVEPIDAPSGGLGDAFEIGPSGTEFVVPITLTFAFDASTSSPDSLRAARYTDDTWEALIGSTVDVEAHTVSGTTTHLSTYGVTTSGEAIVCGPISGGCAAPVGGGGGECALEVSCSVGDPCGVVYAGADLATCDEHAIDNGTAYEGTCCFPVDAPVCVQHATGATCPVGGECPPPATCATSAPCADLEGSTVDSCVDNATGFDAVCCWPPGTPLPEAPETPPVGGGPGAPPPP